MSVFLAVNVVFAWEVTTLDQCLHATHNATLLCWHNGDLLCWHSHSLKPVFAVVHKAQQNCRIRTVEQTMYYNVALLERLPMWCFNALWLVCACLCASVFWRWIHCSAVARFRLTRARIHKTSSMSSVPGAQMPANEETALRWRSFMNTCPGVFRYLDGVLKVV